MKMRLFNLLNDGRYLLLSMVMLAAAVVTLTQTSFGEDITPSKIPDGEAQFTSAQLEDYYAVYKNPDVHYLRKVLNAYLNKSLIDEKERQVLDKFNQDYFRSKFIVMSRDRNAFGGTFITIVFQDRPDKVFVAWVYPEGAKQTLKLRDFKVGDFNDEDIRRIGIRYKKLLADKTHAM